MINKEIASAVIKSYLGTGLSSRGLSTIYEINMGNNELLLEHVKALKNIFERAIKEMEDEMNETNNSI